MHESGERVSRRPWVGPTAALGLALVIGVLAWSLTGTLRVEWRLRSAHESLAVNDPKVALRLLRDRAFDDATDRQIRCRRDSIERAYVRLLKGSNPVREVAGQPYPDGSSAGEFLNARDETFVVISVPPDMRLAGAAVCAVCGKETVSTTPLEPDTAGDVLAEVRTPPLGKPSTFDVILALPLGAGPPVHVPLARGIALRRTALAPALSLAAGPNAHALAGEAVRIPCDVGSPVQILARCAEKIRSVRWAVDDDGAAARTETFEVARDEARIELSELTGRATPGIPITVLATSLPGVTATAHFVLQVRDPSVPLVSDFKLAGQAVVSGGIVGSRDADPELCFGLAAGEVAEDYTLAIDDRPVAMRGERVLVGQLAGVPEGRHRLAVRNKSGEVFAATLCIDRTPPVVTAAVDPAGLNRRLSPSDGPIMVMVPSAVVISATDDAGVRGCDWTIALDGVQPSAVSESQETEGPAGRTQALTFDRVGETTIRVQVRDVAGNVAPPAVFHLVAVDPSAVAAATLGGRPINHEGAVAVRGGPLRVEVRSAAPLDGMCLLLNDKGAGSRTVAHCELARSSGDLFVGEVTPPRPDAGWAEYVAVLAWGPRHVIAEGRFIADFDAPSCAIGAADVVVATGGPLPVVRTGGRRLLPIVIKDNVEVDQKQVRVDGANVDAVVAENPRNVSAVLVVPDAPRATITVHAADAAGNEVVFAFVSDRGDAVLGTATRPGSDGISAGAGPPAEVGLPVIPGGARPFVGAAQLDVPKIGPLRVVTARRGVSRFDPFYLAETELAVGTFRAFTQDLRAATPAGAADAASLVAEAEQALQANLASGRKNDDPAGWISADLATAIVRWANVTAPSFGRWQLPTVEQWKFAAGRALHADAVYPTSGRFEGGADLTDADGQGSFFGRAPGSIGKIRITFQPGNFGLYAMAGGVFEWCTDFQGHPRLIGGGASSGKQDCQIDAPAPDPQGVRREEVGLRLALLPPR